MFKKLIILIALLIPMQSNATICTKQLRNIAKQEGERIGYPHTVLAILEQETRSGTMGSIHDNNTTFGAMCIKPSTAKDVLKSKMSYNKMRSRLIKDDVFSIIVASMYLEYLLEVFDDDISKAILAYNVGLGNVKKHGTKYDPNGYLTSIRLKIRKTHAPLIISPMWNKNYRMG